MADTPLLKDWKMLIEKQLNKATYTEAEIIKLMYQCQDYLSDIQPINQWIGQQHSFVSQMYHIFSEMYLTRFGKQPPPRPTERPVSEVLLDSPESRKQAIREAAISITEPGSDVSDEAVLEELKRRGMKINTFNPTATISTVLRGFKPQFEKVQGKRGIFKRQQ
jgi:hypothetical protein